MITRRQLLTLGGLAGIAAAGRAREVAADDRAALPPRTDATPPTPAARGRSAPVHTPNGWRLPWVMKNGVKEFHLVAEPVEHEFAPGSRAHCWGYNGTTPGPTIEAVEGDRVRILVSNALAEPTSVHWHGLLLPNGMDGVGGLTQPHIRPGETYAYEFTLRQHGTCLYHPHADEMVQLAMGMMGFFIVHPRVGDSPAIDRDYALLLHNWALHPGTRRPDPSIMTEFDLWTFNSKTWPATAPLLARSGERVRIRFGNLSMWNHPLHLHGVQFAVTGGDGGRWPRSAWRPEVTTLVGVGQARDIEFTAVPGDWALHCHMAHHTMGPMGHGLPNPVGVDQSGLAVDLGTLLPGYMPMGEAGMSAHADHVARGMAGPANTLPMMSGRGPFGAVEMGGMFTVLKVRDDLDDDRDPGWYRHPPGEVAARVSDDPTFAAGAPRLAGG